MFTKRFRRQALAAAALASAILPASAAHRALTGDVGVHDPSILQEGDRWFTFSTGEGLQVLAGDSTGRNWTRAPRLFLSPPSWWKTCVPNQKANDVWAPDAHPFNGKVWVYYAISTFGSNTSAIGLVSTTRSATAAGPTTASCCARPAPTTTTRSTRTSWSTRRATRGSRSARSGAG